MGTFYFSIILMWSAPVHYSPEKWLRSSSFWTLMVFTLGWMVYIAFPLGYSPNMHLLGIICLSVGGITHFMV